MGVGEVEQVLRRAGKGYVLGVTGTHRFHSWGKGPLVAGTAEAIAASRPAEDWQRLSAGSGTKGPRLHEWCYVELADLQAGEFGGAEGGLWTRGLLIRRHMADGELAFFSTWCPLGTPMTTLVSRHDGGHPAPGQCHGRGAEKNTAASATATPSLVRWSLQEIRRIATRLARQRINPAHVIAWSLWRRAHQAVAQKAHIRQRAQL